MTHDMTPTTPGSEAGLSAVIANITTRIRVIGQGEPPVIQPHAGPVISLADARPFTLADPRSGKTPSDNGNRPSANYTGAE